MFCAQIENLCLMGSYNYRNDSKDILKMKKQQVTYITKRFLTSRDLDGSILQDDIKYRIQEDLQSGTLPIFINATQDVVSTVSLRVWGTNEARVIFGTQSQEDIWNQ